MSKELREKAIGITGTQLDIHGEEYMPVTTQGKGNALDELITIIRTVTLDEVKDVINSQADYVSSENGGYINYSECIEAIDNYSDCIEAIDNLRGSDDGE